MKGAEPRHAFDGLAEHVAETKVFISRAALLVKVTDRISLGAPGPC